MFRDMSVRTEAVVFERRFGQMSNAPLVSERIVNNAQNRSQSAATLELMSSSFE